MTMLRKFAIALLVVTVVMVMTLFLFQSGYDKFVPLYLEERLLNYSRPRVFLISTDACRIPEVDPFDSSVADLIKPQAPINCAFKPQVTYTTGYDIYINYTVVNVTYNHNMSRCLYQSIKRKNNTDFGVHSGPWIQFSDHVRSKDRYIKVKCEDKNNHTFYTNFHYFVVPDNSTEEILDKKLNDFVEKEKPKDILDVVMIGVDSVSRINFIRHMPKTRNYILKELGGIEMSGYTKVADNTFINIVPMTTGKFVEELPWGEDKKKTFDGYNFIWKNFTSRGYRTFYAEDAPSIAIFHYLKKGFTNPPSYYYNRVLSYAMEKEDLWSNEHNCFQGKLETDIVLDETRDFLQFYQKRPHYVFTFISRMTHDSFNQVASADEPYLRFLEKLTKDGLLNNTVLFFFSDHGSRYGYLRQTFIGKLEERLPLFYVAFPAWFKKKYPDLVKTVESNGKRLTTPFDVYETLVDLVDFQGVSKSVNISNRGLSFFREIPLNRTCEDAGIEPHWCVCLETESLPVSSKQVKKAAEKVVSHLNDILKNSSDVCEKLKVATISSAVQMRPKDQVVDYKPGEKYKDKKDRTKFVVQIQLMFKTKPGLAAFEATVRVDEKKNIFSMVGDVSRINKYGNQSHCVHDSTLKLYCYCKSQT